MTAKRYWESKDGRTTFDLDAVVATHQPKIEADVVCTHISYCIPNLRIHNWEDRDRDRMVIDIQRRVLAIGACEKKEIVSWPADWWQHFRERWMPRWWLRRHPVRKTEHTFTAKTFDRMCPHLEIPQGDRQVHIAFLADLPLPLEP